MEVKSQITEMKRNVERKLCSYMGLELDTVQEERSQVFRTSLVKKEEQDSNENGTCQKTKST